MSGMFEVFVAYIIDHLADGKWSRSDWSHPVGVYSSKEHASNDIKLNANQHLYVQTYTFNNKYGVVLYQLCPCFETGMLPLIISNDQEEMKQTNEICVDWKPLEYDPEKGKYYVPEEDDDNYFY